MRKGYFIPEKDEHQEIAAQIESVLQEEQELKTPQLVDRIDSEYSDGYLRTLLGYAREWMEEENQIDVEWDDTGSGQPHAIWKNK